MQDDLAWLIAERDSLKKANTALIRERDNAITQREYEKELKVKHWAEVHKLLHEHKTLTRERDEARAEVDRLREFERRVTAEGAEAANRYWEARYRDEAAQLTATQARLDEAVGLLADALTGTRDWQRRRFSFLAQQEVQSNA